MKQEYQEIALSRIRPNSWNPRKNFAGEKFDELVKSISEVGVIEPILIRPMADTKDYEIVFGERRWRAACTAAEQNGGIDQNTIPSLIRELTDDDAFDLTTIENLQREDLNELEEANGFKAYADRHGEDSIPELAERIGINHRYIRRRLSVLKLPEKVLAAWGDGRIKYGHLEQLARLQDEKEILKYLEEIIATWRHYTVAELKSEIDRRAPDLKHALFDTKDCKTCSQNSDVQKKLFGEDMEKRRCLNVKCFKQKQNNWLTANWFETEHYKKHKTRGFRFAGDISHNDCCYIYEKSFLRACRTCEKFVTILQITGQEYNGKICLNPYCYREMEKAKAASEPKPEKKKEDGPRVAWHGEHFREVFYQQTLPERFGPIPPEDLKVQRLILFALVRNHSDLAEWFADRHQVKEFNGHGYYCGFSTKPLWKLISGMDLELVKTEIKAFSVQVCMESFCANDRQAMAENVEIDLSKEWRLTEEYLQKKTVAEMMDMGEKLGIFADPKAQNFLYEILMKKRGSFKSCKKKELIRVILESGIDLAGKVPAEILSIDK